MKRVDDVIVVSDASLAQSLKQARDAPIPRFRSTKKERAPLCVGVSVVDDLVRAIIRGDKLETRRPLHRAPKVQAGDELYVRECWTPVDCLFGSAKEDATDVAYRSTKTVIAHESESFECDAYGIEWAALKWRPAIHMPKWAARIFLPLVEVRDEPLHSITDDGVKREGIAPVRVFQGETLTDTEFAKWGYRLGFRTIWDGLYGGTVNAWVMNPMIRVYRWEKARLLC